MKTIPRLLRTYVAMGAIVGPLPNTITDGQAVDAVPVMGNFNWLLSQINSNAAAAATLAALQSTVNGFGARTAFTPGIAFGGAAVGVTYTSQTGYSFALNNLTLVTGSVLVSNKGSSAGVLTLTGFPLAANIASSVIGFPIKIATQNVTIPGSATANYPFGSILPNTSAVAIEGMVSGLGPSAFNNADCATGFGIAFMGLYPTS